VSQNIPIGWTQTTIGEVTADAQQRQPKPREKFTYIDISSIDRETKKIRNPQQLLGEKAPSRARKAVTTGDVLVSMTRPNLNAVAVVPAELDGQIASTGFDVLRPIVIDARWLFYLVRSNGFVSTMSDLVQGALYPAVRSKDVRSFEIPLAPLNEQKRIADKLNVLLTRVDTCRERLERVSLILKLFRQSVLAAAMSEELTEDWPRDNEGWRTLPLGSVLTDIRYGTAQKSHYDIKNGTPVFRIPNIGDGLIDPSDLKFGVFSKKELDTLSLKAGDLLLIRSNGSLELVGKVALVEPKFEGYLYAGYLIRLRLNTSIVVPQFLRFFLSSPDVRRYIELTARSTSGVNNINTEEIRAIQLKLPSIEEQHEIVRRVEVLFAYADRLEARYKAARTCVEQLTPALLSKAFRGELVPQDPKDEPASVLLERIRASRAVSEGALKVRGGGNVQTKTASSTRKVKKSKAKIIMLKRKDVEPSHLSTILKANGPLSAEALWSASQLDIDDFYDQLKDEEARELLRETVGEQRLLEAA
jgi:type I restriction enzyme, S subunit